MGGLKRDGEHTRCANEQHRHVSLVLRHTVICVAALRQRLDVLP